ncbi:Protein-tyrosine phosphatase, receptor/non-receptor type domain and Protein-tyrosine/Dual specificity phosphatase domain and Protein-tyrosine phosphatase, catalytic domain-containing protein [Strongyloides ratti]|uniref:Protein-tyrosine phosphatase, receptor/non-receptor type domain and Protein-tyrosine/Dual specificity phosphatase domain and Protein-tyrosine phosphatase, catalytic domain-containing protein n=1 Tax=Strongyloides ratti TaxID=34506 RepID=A0A090KXA1_STRRB|nr:Protein-tyrosine phosphatase, receptor/non-receptor type domain and Protein-tyrosine/Dual specificity phosphatase domain and Protein-tyrosine phosphatase, catalytic domain-containing protein [Strongyloides ratti]CEF62125.1 Protein-tyrosine phosphatase, receptor/non-receptor type domain and Protein-tyrosine/Dual specificity phosphatase domain and Protein-tyrosine phosphatase, catalytic domain-containing protein [Strongyloides ratti]
MENYECLNNNTVNNAPCPPPPPPPPPPPVGLSIQQNEGIQFGGNDISPLSNMYSKKNNLHQKNNQKHAKSIKKNVSIGKNFQQQNKKKKKEEEKATVEKAMKKNKEDADKGKGADPVQENNELLESAQLSVPAETINEFYEFKGLIDPTAKNQNDKSLKKKIHDQYRCIRLTMNFVFDFMANPTKNRFTNVMMYSEGNCFLHDVDNPEDKYYHANKITTPQGIYIMAQAPLKNTVKTFWDMIWEQGTCIIASFCDYSNKEDCCPYFELSFNKKVKIGQYVIRTEERKISTPAIIFKLKVYNKKTKQGRIVNIINWMGWNPNAIPSITKLLAMMSLVWKMEHIVEVDDKRGVGPILVHGISGSRRTATFVAINILCKQLRDTKKCSVITTAVLIRKYRHNAIRDHLMFAIILLSIMHFAASLNYTEKKDPQFIKASKAIIGFVSTNKAVYKNMNIKDKQQEEEVGVTDKT